MRYRIIILFLIIFSFAVASELPAYVAKYDQDLAIELYRKELSDGNETQENYQALADLYDRTGKVGLAEDCYRHLIDIRNGDEQIYRNYLTFLYQNARYPRLRQVVNENKIDTDWSKLLFAESYFQEGLFDSSFAFSEKLPNKLGVELKSLSLEGMELTYRSPALGGIMSTLIPGSGKIYAGRLLDGMQAFTVVLAPAYNAYYHFAKTGSSSVQAWIWTAVATYFYLSDIYGSVKAVREYNDMLKLQVIERYAP
jgi:tetratricopeptide (TPR) repeat protein